MLQKGANFILELINKPTLNSYFILVLFYHLVTECNISFGTDPYRFVPFRKHSNETIVTRVGLNKSIYVYKYNGM